VQEKRNAIAAELDVTFKHSVAMCVPQAKGRQGVFGGQGACATVRDPARVGPVWEG